MTLSLEPAITRDYIAALVEGITTRRIATGDATLDPWRHSWLPDPVDPVYQS